jgi:hypothetical protein
VSASLVSTLGQAERYLDAPALPLLPPQPNVFYRLAMESIKVLPAAVGAFVPGPWGVIAAPFVHLANQGVRALGQNLNCILLYDGIVISAPAHAPFDTDFGWHKDYLERHEHLGRTSHYKPRIEIYRV